MQLVVGATSIESGMSAENTVDMDEWKEWDNITPQFMPTPSSLILRLHLCLGT